MIFKLFIATTAYPVASLERFGKDFNFRLGVAESEISDDEVVGAVELRSEVEVASRLLPVVYFDARITRGKGVEEGREAVFLQIVDLPFDLLVPAVKPHYHFIAPI